MPVQIIKKILDDMHAHAEATYPEECCGLLISDKTKNITGSIGMGNTFGGFKHHRYSIDPLDLTIVDRLISQRGLTIAGVYHSHPDTIASMSKFDLRHSYSWYTYIIMSVSEGKVCDTRAWIPDKDRKRASEKTIMLVK